MSYEIKISEYEFETFKNDVCSIKELSADVSSWIAKLEHILSIPSDNSFQATENLAKLVKFVLETDNIKLSLVEIEDTCKSFEEIISSAERVRQ